FGKVSIAIQKTIPCLRIGVSVIGLEVPHAHIHLIPLSTMHDINFANPKLKLGSDEMKEIAASIAQNYEA
ncbi:MAG: HIT family protein, partial [Cytophagales bacterium]